jgi:hypothetical protein
MHLYVLNRISYDDQHPLPFGESHGIPEPDRIATLRSSTPLYEEDEGRVSAAAKNGEPDQPAISLLALLATLEMDCVIWGDRDVEPLPYLGCKTTDSSTQSGRWLQFASGVQYSGSRRHQIDPVSCWKRCNDRSGSSRPLLWVKWTGSGFGNLSLPIEYTSGNTLFTDGTVRMALNRNTLQLTTMQCTKDLAGVSRAECNDETGATRDPQDSIDEPNLLDNILAHEEGLEFGGDCVVPIGGAKVLATLSNLRRTSAQMLLRCDARLHLDPTYEPLSTYPIENGTIPNSCFAIVS